MTATNPLLAEWDTPFQMPPFGRIETDHFRPAFEAAFAAELEEVAAIAGQSDAATFENTITSLERGGRALERVAAVFFNLASADTSLAIQEIERDIAPRLAAHTNAVLTDANLFGRVAGLFERKDDLGLDTEQTRVLERYHRQFVRAGAALDEAGKTRMGAIAERLAALTTSFTQNVLADESCFRLYLKNDGDFDGLPDFLVRAAAQNGENIGEEGAHVITLGRSSIDPFLKFSNRRDLREQAFAAWTARGANGGESDNRAAIREIVALRHEQAQLLDSPTFADLKLDDTMAKTPAAVEDLLTTVWAPARKRALEERDALQARVHAEGGNFEIAPWDWHHYAEKVRKAEFDLDETELKPYFPLDRMIEAAFHTANQLFGLSFKVCDDIPMYHPDVCVWEVSDAGGGHVGIFCGDYFARPSKRSGAWMSGYRSQHRLDGDVHPLVVNVCNFIKAPAGEPSLLSYDDATTLFHEFGHALHGLLSDVTYPTVAGTSVSRDFVELPSQLYEHWLLTPEIITRFARHAGTGEAMPQDLLDRLMAAKNFNQGFATVEYLGSAILDMALHQLDPGEDFDVETFERTILDDIAMPEQITARHRLPHFLHLFAGDGYAAGYYSYMWSEVMDADAFEAFTEAGDIFDADTAARLKRFIYSTGGSVDPDDLYKAFRGRGPKIDALIAGRGLALETDASAH